MLNGTDAINPKKELDKDGKRRLIFILALLVVEVLILFGAAGSFNWPAAWLYIGMRMLATLAFSIYIVRTNPEVINERGRNKSGETKPWDKVFFLIYSPTLFIAPLVAGLDAVRFGWSQVPFTWQVAGAVLLIPALILPYWAMAVNPFLVTTVRIQDKRGQYVVDVGPYRLVRHPMYSGVLLMAIAAPLLLGSIWMFVPTGIGALATTVRTYLEDRTLQVELPGYKNYTKRTRFRLVPGLW